AYMVGATTLGGAFAAPPSQTSTGSSAQQPTTSSGQSVQQTSTDANKQATSDTNQKLLDTFMTNFTSRLGVDDAKLNSSFTDAGKSLVDLAAEHHVDAATLKNMVLTTYRSQLDTAVHDGKITQAQADTSYNKFAPEVDNIINSHPQQGNK